MESTLAQLKTHLMITQTFITAGMSSSALTAINEAIAMLDGLVGKDK